MFSTDPIFGTNILCKINPTNPGCGGGGGGGGGKKGNGGNGGENGGGNSGGGKLVVSKGSLFRKYWCICYTL